MKSPFYLLNKSFYYYLKSKIAILPVYIQVFKYAVCLFRVWGIYLYEKKSLNAQPGMVQSSWPSRITGAAWDCLCLIQAELMPGWQNWWTGKPVDWQPLQSRVSGTGA